MPWPSPIDWAWICARICCITQLLPAAAIPPEDAKSKSGHFLWLNFFGWQVPWFPANTNQFGNTQAGKFGGFRSVGSKWAWSTKRYDNIGMRSSQVHNHIPPFLPSIVQKPHLIWAGGIWWGQAICHNHKFTSHNRQLLTAAVSHCGDTQLCCSDAGGELELSKP